MLKTQIVTNTWCCDNCNTETIAQTNPFYSINIVHASPQGVLCSFDLCLKCIQIIDIKIITDYIASTAN